jgi:dTDP-4-dehydrorhamnose reductase
MKPSILLIGTNGQVGRELHKLLPRIGEVTGLDRQRLDLTRSEEIRRAIRTFHPTVIVNAAAYTAVDKAETEECMARSINAEAPAVMADEAKKSGAILIHYSTDYVFDGTKGSPYDENDATNPLNAYGRTKLEGERAIQASGAAHLIFRTTWVYATEGKNFLLTILRLATQREELKIVRDQIGAPTLNREIAEATTKILAQLFERKGGLASAEVSGLYHMTAGGETTWFDFTNAILEQAATIPHNTPWFAAATGGLPLIVQRVIPIAAKEFPLPAKRPAYSIFSNAALNRTFSLQMPTWQSQLSSVFATQIATKL